MKTAECWSENMMTPWVSWTNRGGNVLILRLPAGCCCDMTGAIVVAKLLCPAVRRIETYSGDEPDTQYIKNGKEWEARVPA